MTKKDLFDLAEQQYKIRKENNLFIDKYPSFVIRDIPNDRIKEAIVNVKNSEIKELVVYYIDGSWETLRSE